MQSGFNFKKQKKVIWEKNLLKFYIYEVIQAYLVYISKLWNSLRIIKLYKILVNKTYYLKIFISYVLPNG